MRYVYAVVRGRKDDLGRRAEVLTKISSGLTWTTRLDAARLYRAHAVAMRVALKHDAYVLVIRTET